MIAVKVLCDIQIPITVLIFFSFVPESSEHLMLISFKKIIRKDSQLLLPLCRQSPWVKMTFLFFRAFWRYFSIIQADKYLCITYLARGPVFLCPTLTFLLYSLSVVRAVLIEVIPLERYLKCSSLLILKDLTC